VNHFERLHPALRHHVVNSLGWRELRPFQEAVIPTILEGGHLILIAPTAGGKTEAAFFPITSRILTEGWSGLSTLYICPIRALINDLDTRLQRYSALLGLRSGLWHGDVTASGRRRILRDPPNVLLTTPESLEVMLISSGVEPRRLFANLQAVIVDEIHAFAGDDRGWHLLSVLERIERVAGRGLQRIGLSATVGNPEALIDWLAGSRRGRRHVCAPSAMGAPADADVKLDFVGPLKNAAVVISRLHRGEKRLVFVDSRSRAEELGLELRNLGITSFVTHSSLSRQQRREAEEGFAGGSDCVIVATSALELGIDIGDLDRVIQIDSPSTVSSFLQRMGRTGRRADTRRNCLVLATREESLLQAAALVELWSGGFVEPVQPPPEPYHVLAQQLMGLVLQERGIGRTNWFDWIRRVPAFTRMPEEEVERATEWMIDRDLLWDEEGVLGIGRKGEQIYGRRHFSALMSVFLLPPLFSVRHGRRDLGYVDELTFFERSEGPKVLVLGGRSWRATEIDWRRKVVYVEVSKDPGRSLWKGSGRLLGLELCRAVQELLASDETRDWWSQRAARYLSKLRSEFHWISPEASVVIRDSGVAGGAFSSGGLSKGVMEKGISRGNGAPAWWTFAGDRANAALAAALTRLLKSPVSHDAFRLAIPAPVAMEKVLGAIERLSSLPHSEFLPEIDEKALEGLKFSDCLPLDLALRLLQRRLQDEHGITQTLARPVRYVEV
jgi:ATP-dependent helicase Lhr and Lhr-like helicase